MTATLHYLRASRVYVPPNPKPSKPDVIADCIRASFMGACAAVGVMALFYGPRVVCAVARWAL